MNIMCKWVSEAGVLRQGFCGRGILGYNLIQFDAIQIIESIQSIRMFLGRDLSRESLRRPLQPAPMLRACTSQKRILPVSSEVGYSSVGPYRFREQDLIGKGFSSRVYKAVKSQRQDQIFAIKVINLSKFKASNLAMLQTEIEAHRSMSHPNIVKFHDAYKTENFYYIITEYCPHGDLSALLNQKRKIQEHKALEIICQVISAYLYIAKKGYLHRDLKPANIMRHGNTWKIGDFGFATPCKAEFFFDKLNVGTPLYMPPESLRTNKYSCKSDIFSLGIVFYQMLCGKTPWDCKTQKQLLLKMTKERIKFPFSIKDELKRFIEKACEVNEYDRMSRDELAEFQARHSASNPEESPTHKVKVAQIRTSAHQRRISLQARYRSSKNLELTLKSNLSINQPSSNLSINQPSSNFKRMQKNQSCKILRLEQQESTSISSDNSERPQIASLQLVSSNLVTKKVGELSGTKKGELSVTKKVGELSVTKKVSNTELLLRELQFCRLIYYMIRNIRHFGTGDKNESSFMELVLFKHLLRCIKQLEDAGQHFTDQLVGFAQYKNQKDYISLDKQIRNYVQRYEREYLETLKNADIVVIRSVNRRFPELSYTSPFTPKFYVQFYQYFCQLIKQCVEIDEPTLAQMQAVDSLHTYMQILKEKNSGHHQNNSGHHQNNGGQIGSSMRELGSKIVMDYTRGRQTQAKFDELRAKIALL